MAEGTEEGFYAPPNTPTIYADAVTNLAYSPHVAKFYLSRFDPMLGSNGPAKNQPFVQLAMAMPGFLDMVAFFNWQIQVLLTRKVITQAQVDEAGATYAHRPVE